MHMFLGVHCHLKNHLLSSESIDYLAGMIVLKDYLVFGTVQAVSFHGVIWLSNHFLGSFQTC